jgi:hypothetical protein
VKHALTALKESSQNGEINSKNTSISIVGEFFKHTILNGDSNVRSDRSDQHVSSGPDHPFKVFDSEDVQPVNAFLTTFWISWSPTSFLLYGQFVDLVDKDEISEASAAAPAPAAAEGMQEWRWVDSDMGLRTVNSTFLGEQQNHLDYDYLRFAFHWIWGLGGGQACCNVDLTSQTCFSWDLTEIKKKKPSV